MLICADPHYCRKDVVDIDKEQDADLFYWFVRYDPCYLISGFAWVLFTNDAFDAGASGFQGENGHYCGELLQKHWQICDGTEGSNIFFNSSPVQDATTKWNQLMFQDSFEAFINTRQNKPAEMIAKFVDSKVPVTCKGENCGTLELVAGSIVDQNTLNLNLDPDPEFWSNMDPDTMVMLQNLNE